MGAGNRFDPVGQSQGWQQRRKSKRSFALELQLRWRKEKCVSQMPKGQPEKREMALPGDLRPPRDLRPKILLLHLTLEQAEAPRWEETCSRSPSQRVAKLVWPLWDSWTGRVRILPPVLTFRTKVVGHQAPHLSEVVQRLKPMSRS